MKIYLIFLLVAFVSAVAVADGPAYVCSNLINGNINSSSVYTITGGKITLDRRIINGTSEVDVNPQLTCTAPCGDFAQVTPAAHWFSGVNPFPSNNHIITIGPSREDDSALEIHVEGGSTYENGNKTFMVRHALHLDKKTGLLTYIAQVKLGGRFGTGLSKYETRVAVQMQCQPLN